MEAGVVEAGVVEGTTNNYSLDFKIFYINGQYLLKTSVQYRWSYIVEGR